MEPRLTGAHCLSHSGVNSRELQARRAAAPGRRTSDFPSAARHKHTGLQAPFKFYFYHTPFFNVTLENMYIFSILVFVSMHSAFTRGQRRLSLLDLNRKNALCAIIYTLVGRRINLQCELILHVESLACLGYIFLCRQVTACRSSQAFMAVMGLCDIPFCY